MPDIGDILKQDIISNKDKFEKDILAFNAMNCMMTVDNVKLPEVNIIGQLLVTYNIQDRKTLLYAHFKFSGKVSLSQKLSVRKLRKTNFCNCIVLSKNSRKGVDVTYVNEDLYKKLG